jgi:hypothetical protein
MAAKASASLITFAVINVFVGIIPPCSGCMGLTFYMNNDAPFHVEGRDMRPQLNKHLELQAPRAKTVAIMAAVGYCMVAIPLIGGAVGLFMAQNWARWVTIVNAGVLMFVILLHDIYLLAVLRPAAASFAERVAPRGPEGDGFVWGFSMGFVSWACFNPFILLYLIVMSICLMTSDSFASGGERKRKRRDRSDDDDDDDEDRPRKKRRRYDDEDDDGPPRRPRKRRRDDDDDD